MKKGIFSSKLAAFTLMELAVGMVLTSVTVAAGFSLYLFFTKTIQKHSEDEQLVKNLHAYYFLMKNDLEKATAIFPAENGITLISNHQKIIYHLEDTLLIREIPEQSSDTFWVHTSEFMFPEPIHENEKLTSFSITQRLNKQEMIWQWKKEYAPAESINQYILENGH